MHKLKQTSVRLSAFFAAAGLTVAMVPARALAACGDPNQGLPGGVACAPKSISLSQAISQTVNLLLFIVGVASVIVLIVGGLRYVLSGGDPKNTAAAKDTILYAVIGIVVALLSWAIVSFILNQFS